MSVYKLGMNISKKDLRDLIHRGQITSGIPLSRLEEICQAERDGRCVVLPIPFGKGKEIYGIAEDDCDSEVPKSIITICCDELDHVEIWPSGELVVTVDGWEVGWSDICKTVFLTRAEAEAALEGMQHE